MEDVPPPSAKHEVAEGGWEIPRAISAVGLGENPLRAWAAPNLEFRNCVRDATPGGEAIGEYQAVFEGHRGAFGHVGRRRVRRVPDEQHRSA
jgi:hypothetical protein